MQCKGQTGGEKLVERIEKVKQNIRAQWLTETMAHAPLGSASETERMMLEDYFDATMGQRSLKRARSPEKVYVESTDPRDIPPTEEALEAMIE